MKLFILQNWYRLSIVAAMLLLSFSCLLFTIKNNTVNAGAAKLPSYAINNDCGEKNWVVGCGNYIYEVTYNAFTEKYEFKIIGPVQDY